MSPGGRSATAQSQRGSLFVEEAVVTDTRQYDGNQFVLRLYSPKCAAAATAGTFIHLRCDESIPMRRPLSIMRANAEEGSIEVLFKIVGDGLKALAKRQPGDRLSSIGPIGRGFAVRNARPRAVLIGGGVGIPPMIFLAEQMHRQGWRPLPLVLMGSELPYPFACRRSNLAAGWADGGTFQTIASLEDLGVCARLASQAGFAGAYRGYVSDLASRYLGSLSAGELAETELFACGPAPMLRAVAKLAGDFGLPCQIALEEYMACAVGGCAGCAVRITTGDGPAMKRVCVDGPVFEASQVFPAG
ncbi:MAG: dihydroorotate dehydrogenase electron transfer subunit [Woeseiaceae bacterium]|nr:dihydroorotate dehydrogenase electron transfer subunit [Woeseiaceae bacterium]